MCRGEGDEASGALFESILRNEIAHSAAFRALIEGAAFLDLFAWAVPVMLAASGS